jgi:hypothetical protein
MISCDLKGFYCESHKCGANAEGELVLCLKEGCPHCGAGPAKMSGKKYRQTVELHGRAQEAVIRWEAKPGTALSRLQAARAEERKLKTKLEKAERDGVIPETEEQSMSAAGYTDQYGSGS